jgi:hypothetical protein
MKVDEIANPAHPALDRMVRFCLTWFDIATRLAAEKALCFARYALLCDHLRNAVLIYSMHRYGFVSLNRESGNLS